MGYVKRAPARWVTERLWLHECQSGVESYLGSGHDSCPVCACRRPDRLQLAGIGSTRPQDGPGRAGTGA